MLPTSKALLIGGACYGVGVYYMSNYYYKNSEYRKIFVRSDDQYANVKVGHCPPNTYIPHA